MRRALSVFLYFLMIVLSLAMVNPPVGPGTASAAGSQRYTPTPVSDLFPPNTILIRIQDNGRTFTIRPGTLILLMVPRLPGARLAFDPTILRLLPDEPRPMYDLTSGWRLAALRPGTTQLAVRSEFPCDRFGPDPCPKMPEISFFVTIVVIGSPTPPPPIPPLPLPRSDIYIGTAYLEQTVHVRPGQILTLDLPFLVAGQSIRLEYEPTILRNYGSASIVPPGGWQFAALRPGETAIAIRDTLEGKLYFRVWIVVEGAESAN